MMHADFAAFLKVLDGALNVAGVAAQDLSEACDRQRHRPSPLSAQK